MSDTLNDGARLVFVYNADAGLFNALTDAAHKLLSPATYRCNLCALTHHHLGMRRGWKEFTSALGTPVEFLHADELKERGVVGVELPAVFREEGGQLELLINADEINACRTLEDLQRLVTTRTRAQGL